MHFCLLVLSTSAALADVKVADLKDDKIHLNYINPQTKPNFVDKVAQTRTIEGNQELASFALCSKELKEFDEKGRLKSVSTAPSEACLSLMTVNNLYKTVEDSRRGENKRRSTIQTITSVAGGIRLLMGW